MGLNVLSPFHFLHPAWLTMLPVLLLLAVWQARRSPRDVAWTRVMDSELLAMLRMGEGRKGASPWWLVGTIWCLTTLALAGPAWMRTATPAYGSRSAWVLVFDLSPSMNGKDLSPDRATRARYVASDLLSAAHGARVGLVAFAGEAHTVAPLTSDVATVRTLLGPLAPGLMPEDGDNLAPALSEAKRLLSTGYAPKGEIIVLSDGFADPAASFNVASQLRRSGVIVNVVGIADATGDQNRSDELRRVAAAGGGMYVSLNNVSELISHLGSQASLTFSATTSDLQLQQWQNEGVWLLVPILILGAALARRGWV